MPCCGRAQFVGAQKYSSEFLITARLSSALKRVNTATSFHTSSPPPRSICLPPPPICLPSPHDIRKIPIYTTIMSPPRPSFPLRQRQSPTITETRAKRPATPLFKHPRHDNNPHWIGPYSEGDYAAWEGGDFEGRFSVTHYCYPSSEPVFRRPPQPVIPSPTIKTSVLKAQSVKSIQGKEHQSYPALL